MEEVSRRNFLTTTINVLIGVWAAVAAVLSGFAGIRYIWPTEKTAGPPGEDKVSFPVADLPEGGMKKIVIGGKPVGIIKSNETLYALSLICTHLGCIVNWHPEQNRLICPCHAGAYDLNGAVVAGPPPRPLPSYEVKLSGDKVVVG